MKVLLAILAVFIAIIVYNWDLVRPNSYSEGAGSSKNRFEESRERKDIQPSSKDQSDEGGSDVLSLNKEEFIQEFIGLEVDPGIRSTS